jgi:hypothetical protein
MVSSRLHYFLLAQRQLYLDVRHRHSVLTAISPLMTRASKHTRRASSESTQRGPIVPISDDLIKDGFRLYVHVKPGAKHDAITGIEGDRLGVQVNTIHHINCFLIYTLLDCC